MEGGCEGSGTSEGREVRVRIDFGMPDICAAVCNCFSVLGLRAPPSFLTKGIFVSWLHFHFPFYITFYAKKPRCPRYVS